jgi:RNA polymerase sigma-70 factor, ECF subfamily
MVSRSVIAAKSLDDLNEFGEIKREADLATRLRAGDMEAIEELFYAYFERLFSFIYQDVGKNRLIAEDILQDTFLNAIKSARNFKGNSHVYTWLVGIAHHKISDYYRRIKREHRHLTLSYDDYSEDLFRVSENSAYTENIVESTEAKLVVEQVLQKLPLHYRQVLLLKYIEDLPMADISRILNRSVKSVDGLLHQARKAFKYNLDKN